MDKVGFVEIAEGTGNMQSVLAKLQVSRERASSVNQRLREEQSYSESNVQFQETRSVRHDDKSHFFKSLAVYYPDRERAIQKSLDKIVFDDSWSIKVFEYKYVQKDYLSYEMLVVEKPSFKTINFTTVKFSMNYKEPSDRSRVHGIRAELKDWMRGGSDESEGMQDYFRMKVMECCKERGLITEIPFGQPKPEIPYVPTLPKSTRVKEIHDEVPEALPVRISEAVRFEKQLEKELVVSYKEESETSSSKGIELANLSAFLEHVQNAYFNGVEFEGITYDREHWRNKIIEVKYNDTDDRMFWYGIVVLRKNPRRETFDCQVATHKFQLKVRPRRATSEIVAGLANFQVSRNQEDHRDFKNYFRYQALKKMREDGLISQINNEY